MQKDGYIFTYRHYKTEVSHCSFFPSHHFFYSKISTKTWSGSSVCSVKFGVPRQVIRPWAHTHEFTVRTWPEWKPFPSSPGMFGNYIRMCFPKSTKQRRLIPEKQEKGSLKWFLIKWFLRWQGSESRFQKEPKRSCVLTTTVQLGYSHHILFTAAVEPAPDLVFSFSR